MTLLLKPFLRELVAKALAEATSFPVQLPRNPRPMQIKRFTSFRDGHETGKHIIGEVCEKEDYISAFFTADCCNKFEKANDGERLSSKTGLLLYAPQWRLDIAHKLKNGTYSFKAIVYIDEVELIGEMAVIGDDPRDFNSRQLVQDILADPSRRDIYLKRSPAADDEPASQPERSTPFRTQAETPLSSQRRPLGAEEAGAWAEMEELLWGEYQIDARQQGMLASDNAWFHPANIERYQRKESATEEERPSGTLEVVEMDGQHPPLASPEASPPVIANEVFQTQAVPTMDGSQTNGGDVTGNGGGEVNGHVRDDEGHVVEATPNVETSAETVFEWEATPPPENPEQDGPMEVNQAVEKAQVTSNETAREEEEPYGSQILPLSVLGPAPTNGPPSLNSNDEESDDDVASQGPLEDEGGNGEDEEPLSQEIFFDQDNQREARESTEENVPGAASMAVSTAQILSQHVSETAETGLTEVIKVSEMIGEEPLQEDEIVHETSAEIVHVAEADNVQEDEAMQEVERTEVLATQHPTGIQGSVSIVEREDVHINPTNEHQKEFVVPATILADQSTNQDDSTTTQIPNSPSSNPSNPAQDDPAQQSQTKSQENPTSHQGTIPSTQSPIIQEAQQPVLPPGPPIAVRAMSPSKGTPVPASIQIQVQETPPGFQPPGLVEETEPASSAVRISGTAPSSLKRPAPEVDEPARRKHKRDRHVGPIVPRFSRQDRKMNCDLEAILLEHRRSWIAENNVEPMEKEPTEEVQGQEDVMVVEEVVIEKVIKEEEQIQEVDETQTREDEDGQGMEDLQVTEQPTIVKVEREAPLPGEKEKDVIITDEEEMVIDEAKDAVQQPLANELQQPEPLPRATPSETTRWGRFAAHWRRFAPFIQINPNI